MSTSKCFLSFRFSSTLEKNYLFSTRDFFNCIPFRSYWFEICLDRNKSENQTENYLKHDLGKQNLYSITLHFVYCWILHLPILYLGASTLDERCSWAAGTRPVKQLFCPSPLKTKDPIFMLDDAILSKTINQFSYQHFLTKTMSCIFQILHSCSLQLRMKTVFRKELVPGSSNWFE